MKLEALNTAVEKRLKRLASGWMDAAGNLLKVGDTVTVVGGRKHRGKTGSVIKLADLGRYGMNVWIELDGNAQISVESSYVKKV